MKLSWKRVVDLENGIMLQLEVFKNWVTPQLSRNAEKAQKGGLQGLSYYFTHVNPFNVTCL